MLNRLWILLLSSMLVASACLVFAAPRPAPDPWNGVPVCTTAIAEAGGICHGEPIDY